MEGHRHILLATQRQLALEDPEPEDIHEIGVVAEVLQVLKVPDGTMRVMLEGICRFRIKRFVKREPFFLIRGEPIVEDDAQSVELEALMRSAMTEFEQIAGNARSIPPEAVLTLMNIEEPGRLADHIAWQNCRWTSIEEFKAVQTKWSHLGLIAAVLNFMVLVISMYIAFNP